jgi:hypothetical protein
MTIVIGKESFMQIEIVQGSTAEEHALVLRVPILGSVSGDGRVTYTGAARLWFEQHADAPKSPRCTAEDPPRARPKLRNARYPMMNQLNIEQMAHFHEIAATYIPDMHELTAVEVLLVLLEICHILDIQPAAVEQIFGERVLRGLETWGDIVVPSTAGSKAASKAPGQEPRRAWVWIPGRIGPMPCRIDENGSICVYSNSDQEQE